jgi:hypothetical protein
MFRVYKQKMHARGYKDNKEMDNKVHKNGTIIPPGPCSLVHVYFIAAYRPAGNLAQDLTANV